MKLCDILNEDTILVPMNATERSDAIQELLNKLVTNNVLTTSSKLYKYIDETESHQSTAAGKGVAYPHSTSIEIDSLTVILGISLSGIDYNAPDGQPCHFILLTLTPLQNPNMHRKFITLFRTMIENPRIRTMILDSACNADIYNIINTWDIEETSLEDLE